MGIKQIKVDVNDVIPGMFVSSLDRPWSQTPFPVNGFYVRDVEDVRQLKTHCRFVYVDVVKGAGTLTGGQKTLSRNLMRRDPRAANTAKAKVDVAPLKVRHNAHELTADVKTEMVYVRKLYPLALAAMQDLFRQLREGKPPLAEEIKHLASEMVDSVLRNPDALTWASRLKSGDQDADEAPGTDRQLAGHCLRAAVWALIFGRHIGLERKDLNFLAAGVLLKDIGKTRIEPRLLGVGSRPAAEERKYEQFVEFSAAILRHSPEVEPRIISVVKTHCERVNGSGCPQQLKGDKIPLLGKIAGIVTFYDRTVYAPGEVTHMSPSRAVAKLYECRDREFQEELVVEFIRAIGLYPTGTLVELNTGQVAVVMEQNFERRLKPKVVIVLGANRSRLPQTQFLDLAADDRAKQALVDSGEKRLEEVDKIEIVQDLDGSGLDVDIAAVQDHYMVVPEQKKKGLLTFFRRGNN